MVSRQSRHPPNGMNWSRPALTVASDLAGIAAVADRRVLELVSCLAEFSSLAGELFTALVPGAKLVFTAEIAVCPARATFLMSDTSALGLLTLLSCSMELLKLVRSEQHAGLLLPPQQ
jgi:hypothetical protein